MTNPIRLMVDRDTREPAFIIYPSERVEFRDTHYLRELQLSGFNVDPETLNEYRESLKSYLRGNRVFPPNDKATAKIHQIFAKLFEKHCEEDLLSHGYDWQDPELLDLDALKIKNFVKTVSDEFNKRKLEEETKSVEIKKDDGISKRNKNEDPIKGSTPIQAVQRPKNPSNIE